MAERTGISWADATFNPWIGCTRVSPACDNCYAEAFATARLGVGWGPHAVRRRTQPSTWNLVRRWDRKAARTGIRTRVFCASLADVFDAHVDPTWREDLWQLVQETPNLDWLLLTKRPMLITPMLPPGWGRGWSHVWLGTTAENQQEAERRIPHLLAAPAAHRFLSCEPLLGELNLTHMPLKAGFLFDALRGVRWNPAFEEKRTGRFEGLAKLDWIIAGGESGRGARPMHPDWPRRLRDDCAAAGTPFHFKQWGEWGADALQAAPGDGSTPAKRMGARRTGRLLDGAEHLAGPHG